MTDDKTKFTMAKKFTNKSRAEFLEFRGNMKDILHFHKYKLHTLLFEGELHKSVLRMLQKNLKDEGIEDEREIEERTQELIETCSEDAFAILMLNISDTTLRDRLRRDYDDDGHSAWQYIESLYKVKDNDTRVTKAADIRKDLVDDGLTGATEDIARKFVEQLLLEQLLQHNKELEDTPHHWADALLTSTLLDALAVHMPEVVRGYKVSKINTSGWRDDFDAVCKEVFALLEENDRTEAKTAAGSERRAYRTSRRGKADMPAEDQTMTSLLEELKCLRTQVNALRTGTSSSRGTPCADCGGLHRGECYGKLMATGQLTAAQAADKFKHLADPAAQARSAAAALRRYQEYQAARAGKTAGGAAGPAAGAGRGEPPKIPPKLCAMTKVVQCCLQQRAPLDAVLAATRDRPLCTMLRVDTQCDQHMFNDERFFPYGYTTVDNITVGTAVAGQDNIPAYGVGTALTFVDGVAIEWTNALLVPGLKECLGSYPQACQQYDVELHSDRGAPRLVFPHAGQYTVHLDKQFNMQILPADAQQLDIIREHAPDVVERNTPPGILTRGKHGGGPAARLPQQDAIQLWSARLPGVSAERMRALPEATADAPAVLAHAHPALVADDATLSANAPRIRAPPADRVHTERRGQVTATDLLGPFPPSKFYGNRYAAPFIDMHDNTCDVRTMPSKDKYPQALRAYLRATDGLDGADVKGGTVYSDNELVLNSSRVDRVLDEYHMHATNTAVSTSHGRTQQSGTCAPCRSPCASCCSAGELVTSTGSSVPHRLRSSTSAPLMHGLGQMMGAPRMSAWGGASHGWPTCGPCSVWHMRAYHPSCGMASWPRAQRRASTWAHTRTSPGTGWR